MSVSRGAAGWAESSWRRSRLWVCAVVLFGGCLIVNIGTAQAAGPPSFGHQQALTTTDTATVEALIDPNGSATTCQVQYVSEADFQASGWNGAIAQPCAEGLGAGESERAAFVEIASLTIDTGYHYRFIAENQTGSVTGPEATFSTYGVESFAFEAIDQQGNPFVQAGGHPYEQVTRIILKANEGVTRGNGGGLRFGELANLKDIKVQLPPGLIGNPAAAPKCPYYATETFKCTSEEQIGTMELLLDNIEPSGEYEKFGPKPLFNVVPPTGVAARLSARFNNFANAIITAHVRTGTDYGIDADSLNITSLAAIKGIIVRLWGVPADPSHTPERACLLPGESYGEGCASPAPEKSFVSMPTACAGPTSATVSVDSYQQPGAFTPLVTDQMPAVTGCAAVGFAPSIEVRPTTDAADSPTGLNLDLHVPQNEDPAGVSSADLKNAVVRFPQGVTVDPSSADGLQACSEAQVGFTGFTELNATGEPGVQTAQFTPGAAECPDASKLGTVQIDTPLLEHPVTGAMYLAKQTENPFGSLLALYLAVDDPISGVILKLPGMVRTNPQTGQLTAIFDQNPQLPFEDLKVDLFSGSRAALSTPSTCGAYATSTTLTPWTSPQAPDASPSSAPFQIGEAPGGGACASDESQAPNSPGFEAGTASPVAGTYSPFVLKLSREDGSQRFASLNVTLPPGLLGKIAGVEECPQADIEAAARRTHEGEGALEQAHPSCPAGSEVGLVHVGAGTGAPFYVTGHAYFAGPYAGAPFSFVIVTPALAGPFDLGTVVVRAALLIDPTTSQVTVKSDPLPSMLDGIPLDVRSIAVDMDRPEFTLNPTSCEVTSVTGQARSTVGQSASVSDRFQAGGCTGLPFKPGFSVSTSAKSSRADGTSVMFRISYPAGALGKEAWLKSAKFEFPKQLPARLSTIQKSCPAATFDANPASCSAASRIGTSRVRTELLPVPLEGPVYFVSNGNAKFPEAVIVLQGDDVTVELHSETFINEKTGVTSATLASIPGVPFEEAVVTLPAGPYSEFTAVGSLCTPTTTKSVKKKVTVDVKGRKKRVTRTVKQSVATPLLMPTGFTGQNGATIKQDTPVTVTECAKSKPKTVKKSGKKRGKGAGKGGKGGKSDKAGKGGKDGKGGKRGKGGK
jgi:hypothetical protein